MNEAKKKGGPITFDFVIICPKEDRATCDKSLTVSNLFDSEPL